MQHFYYIMYYFYYQEGLQPSLEAQKTTKV